MVTVSSPKTSNYTILSEDEIIAIGTLNSDIVVTLPSDPVLGDQYSVKDINGTVGLYKVTVEGDGYNIDGNTSMVLAHPYAACTMTFTGDQWGVTWSYAGKSNGNGLGLLSNRPVQGQAGRTYYAQDQTVFYYDDGYLWQPLGPQINLLKTPKVADFTWVNQNGCSAVDTGSGIYLQTLGFNMGIHNSTMLVRPTPSTPYTITACFLYCGMTTFDTMNGPVGLCFRQSSNGELHAYTIDFNGLGIAKITLSYYLDHSTFMMPYLERESSFASSIMWFKLRDDGINRYCEYSRDGINYTNFYFTPRTTDLVADQVGFFVNPLFQDIKVTLVSWEET